MDTKKTDSMQEKKKECETVNLFVTKHYGKIPLVNSEYKTSREWCDLDNLFLSLEKFEKEQTTASYDYTTYQPKDIWLRARLYESRCKGSINFFILRQKNKFIQAVLNSKTEGFDKEGVKWCASIPLESVVDIKGTIVKAFIPVLSCTFTRVEISISKFFCVTESLPELPFQLKDAMRSDENACEDNTEVNKATKSEQKKKPPIIVKQDVRLDHRVIDLRTPANYCIFKIQSAIGHFFRYYLYKHKFIEIHTPKLMSGYAEGGASVFKLKYFDQSACLAQSPQLHKQMAICSDFYRVFEICPVFRAENSNTHRHLCEFTGMDIEMEITEHYDEVVNFLDGLFKYIFEQLSAECAKDLEEIHKQHLSEPLKWISNTPRLTYAEGFELLKKAGAVPDTETAKTFDLSTDLEKLLGEIIKKKYGTDFYIMDRYPLQFRPFYTMPAPDDPELTNSYDFFIRGEEILSGAQRIHDPELLTKRAKECDLDVSSIKAYLNSFRYGVPPHGGCGIGLERVVMLFIGLGNIRKTSLYPRDPKRLNP